MAVAGRGRIACDVGVEAEVADRLVAAGPRPISPNPVTTVRGGLEIGRGTT